MMEMKGDLCMFCVVSRGAVRGRKVKTIQRAPVKFQKTTGFMWIGLPNMICFHGIKISSNAPGHQAGLWKCCEFRFRFSVSKFMASMTRHPFYFQLLTMAEVIVVWIGSRLQSMMRLSVHRSHCSQLLHCTGCFRHAGLVAEGASCSSPAKHCS